MLLLAFETSAKAASVALFEDQKLLAQQYQNTAMTHSQTLLVMARDLLAQCGITPQQVNAVAVANGPGSFTGIRIGAAAAKGFAWGNQLPVYGVSTLEAMALGLGIHQGIVCPVMDARRNQVYNGIFRFDSGKCTRLQEDRAISLEDLEKELKNFQESIFLVGDGSILCYNTLLKSVPQLILPAEHRMQQQAAGVGLAALQRIAAGDPGDGSTMVPNYLRLSQAERERLERSQNT